MRSQYFKIILTTLFITIPLLKGFAQIDDDQSNGVYRETYLKKSWNKLDKNQDELYTKSENERRWKRLRYLDLNKDKSISKEEYRKIRLPYLNHGGERKLNVLYKETKEGKLYLDIYYPESKKEGEQLPVVIYTHGGGWAAGSRHGAANASFKKVHNTLLEKGFCVVSVSYRLWNKKGDVTMRDCVIDCKDAMRYLSKHNEMLGVDTNRFFSFGDSAGGQISQMLLLSTPESLTGDPTLSKYSYKMIAGVSWYGPCDFEKSSLFNHNDRPDFKDRFGPRIVKSNTKAEDKILLYKEMSPINYLNKNSSPLLLIQGDKDTTIPVKHAYHMAERAKEIGAPVSTIIIKNAGHNWRKVGADIEPTREEIIQKTVDYFVAHLN